MNVKSIEWKDRTLILLDQRRLPASVAWLSCRTAEDVARAIEQLAGRGASAIGIAAA